VPSPLPAPLTTALQGVRVIDFSHVIAGPFATFHLAQMGAQVTKVERPGGGDVMRRTASGLRGFTALNHGKTCLECDIGTPQGQAQVLELAREADVLVDNYRPGVLERKGLGYEALKRLNPRLIYCAISGYGHLHAAIRSRGAYDHVVQALTGMTMLAGEPGQPPLKVGFPVIDSATGMLGALAIVSALRERDHSGVGCFIDISMWACALQLMYSFTCDTLSTGQEIPRVGNKGFSGSPAADTYACREGWLAVGANTPAQVQHLLRVLGFSPTEVLELLEPDRGDGPRFAQARDPQQFRHAVATRLAQREAAHWEAALNEQGVPAARVRTLREFTHEATEQGWLQPLALGVGEARALTPGLGWQAQR
jgi:crotonobetainyl-CoA:carnitine CoA-transferase CaiB-like acyl-CoA transferase